MLIREINLDDAQQFLAETVIPQAGAILRRKFESGNLEQRQKDGVDFTTQADEEADIFIVNNLRSRFPQSQFLTEETAPQDFGDLSDADNLWVIDPLDGTTHHARGRRTFAISIALARKGRIRLGMIYVPMENSLYWATEDTKEAYMNNEPIHTSQTQSLREAILVCEWAWGLDNRKKVISDLDKLCTSVRQVISIAAVYDLALLAAGKSDIHFHYGLYPWDVAAASLIIEKAGGKITTPDGKEWNVFNPDMLATNGLLHQQVLDLTFPKR